jgi:hypothetical protein
MKAQVVPAVILTEDDGKVFHIAFSRESAEVILAVHDEYATDDPNGAEKERKIDAAKAVVQFAGLPQGGTIADAHYLAAIGTAEGLRSAVKRLSRRNGDAEPAAQEEECPDFGYAPCFFLRIGRHGLRLAFSSEAAEEMCERLPFASLAPHQVEAIKNMIDGMRLPFPVERVPLDYEFDEMCRSLTQVHR